MENLTLENLTNFYVHEKKSVAEIAKIIGLSETGVNYWFKKFGIPKRSVSEAIYIKHNPKGDPFTLISPRNLDEAKLFGLGIGLYWGEGTKANKNTIRLGNSDPAIIRIFIKFLKTFFRIDKKKLKFHLHIFTDINLQETKNYWKKEIKIEDHQFYKTDNNYFRKIREL